MKVLILNGSPKKEHSNTLKLTNSFLNGMNEYEEIEAEYIHVYQKEIKPCSGCFCCWTKTPGQCIYQDDMKEMIFKLLEADIIIWSFPLYYFGMPSGMKAFMDRMLPMNLPFMSEREDGGSAHPPRYPQMTQIKHVLISTCGFHSKQNNYEGLEKQFEICFGNTNQGRNFEKILCPEGELFRVPELRKRTNEYLEHVCQAGREYVLYGSITDKTQEQLNELLFPADMFMKMADASWDISDTSQAASAGVKSEQNSPSDIQTSALGFTKQMAALYNNKSWKKKDIVLEMHYTDLNQTYQIWLLEHGSKVVEDSNQFLLYTARVETPLTVWKDIGAGKLDSMKALIEKKYKILGDLAFMSQWEVYFGGTSNTAKQKKDKIKEKQSSLWVLLFPWLIVWIAIPIHSYWGSFAAMLGTAVIVLSYFVVRLTPYDIISIFICGMISALGLIGVPILWLIPAAYLLFGMLWIVSAFLPIPLSAWYSCNQYGGLKNTKNNLLFISTNRILTICWGILYLCTPIWTFFLMQTDFSKFVSLINSAFPVLLGLFTWWFQKWYPARKAAGK